MRTASLVIDAVLGTGAEGPPKGKAAEVIESINRDFPLAEVVAVDVPSGGAVRARHTVTFTALKPSLVLPPAYELAGKIHVVPIGTPPELVENDPTITLSMSDPADFAALFEPRPSDSNKGQYGHVLVIAGGRGKTGAAAMAGIAALRAGAGLSTVASAASAISAIAAYAPEIMTEPLAETDGGSIAMRAPDDPSLAAITEKKTVIAIGPGMGQHPETVQFIRRFAQKSKTPMVVDADALNALAGQRSRFEGTRIFTPHPGEMSRLTGKTIAEIQQDRIGMRAPRHRARCLFGAEGRPQRDCFPGQFAGVDQPHRVPVHGHRRYRRRAYRNDRATGGGFFTMHARAGADCGRLPAWARG